MMQQEMVKVYELAKELGIDSISLLDRLKDLNIKVKNHMSELSDSEAQAARSALKPAAAPKAAKKAPAARVKKKAAEAAPAAAPVEEKPAGASLAPASKSAPVIRRRTKSDGVTETVTHGMPVTAKAASETAEVHEAPAAHPSEETQVVETLHESGTQEVQTVQEEVTQETPVDAAPAVVETPEASVQAAPEAPAVTPRPPIAPFVRPVAPRRSILKIVEPTAPAPRPMIKPAPAPAATSGGPVRPSLKGTSTQDKDGFRIIKMTKENLDQMAEEEAAKKRAGAREAEIRPEDVRFADYRKKEMVFLPKKKRLPVGKEIRRTEKTVAAAHKRVVEMQETISIQDFANQMSVKAMDVVRKLMGMGQMLTINSSIDFDTATLIASEYKFEVRNVSFKEEEVIAATVDTAEMLVTRPPVVTIMGHVDHGKTTLLDSIREANVAAGEAGGITQHIGAYTIQKNDKWITFIDTPGHEAFTVMRARGANVTDIVILVVSADDGVMPQTREALSHAQAAGVPIIVAVNKMDKPGANPEKIRQALAELNLLAEDWGGQTQFVHVSALKKTGIDQLLEAILLQAEILDLKANPNVPASGVVLEARLEKGRGPVISVLVNRGTLKVGDAIVSGIFSGRVKALTDDKGREVKEASPGTAAEVLGLEGVPGAGENFAVALNEADARAIAGHRLDKQRAKTSGTASKMSLDDLFSKIQSGQTKSLEVILKTDVYGSLEAVRDSLVKLSNDKVKVKVIHTGTGGITESDVMLASASNALIVGFNVRPETKARQIAESEHVEIKCYSIIYELIDDVRNSMIGLLDKKKVEKFLGRAEVRQTFTVPKLGIIAGSAVVDGKILRGANVRLLRDSRVIFEGKLSSLRRFKDDAKEVATGFECGIGIENYNDIKAGDIIEAFQIELVTPELNG